jgi:hypothetical protein
MLTSVDLYLRSSQLDPHRAHGIVVVELDGRRLAPHEEVRCEIDGRQVRARITAIRQRPDRLPHVYADEITADEMAC